MGYAYGTSEVFVPRVFLAVIFIIHQHYYNYLYSVLSVSYFHKMSLCIIPLMHVIQYLRYVLINADVSKAH